MEICRCELYAETVKNMYFDTIGTIPRLTARLSEGDITNFKTTLAFLPPGYIPPVDWEAIAYKKMCVDYNNGNFEALPAAKTEQLCAVQKE